MARGEVGVPLFGEGGVANEVEFVDEFGSGYLEDEIGMLLFLFGDQDGYVFLHKLVL